MSDQQKPTPRKKSRVVLTVIIITVLAAGGLFAGWYFFLRDMGPKPFEFDTAALQGRIKVMTDAEILEELNRVVEEGMFNISIASNIVFANPDAQGEARIENIAANPYHMQVDIALAEVLDEETGEVVIPSEVVYSSKGLMPGTYIERISLDKRLEPGEYAATAVFHAITQDTYQLVGAPAAKIRLTILDLDAPPTPTPSPTPTPTPTPTPAPTATPAPSESPMPTDAAVTQTPGPE